MYGIGCDVNETTKKYRTKMTSIAVFLLVSLRTKVKVVVVYVQVYDTEKSESCMRSPWLVSGDSGKWGTSFILINSFWQLNQCETKRKLLHTRLDVRRFVLLSPIFFTTRCMMFIVCLFLLTWSLSFLYLPFRLRPVSSCSSSEASFIRHTPAISISIWSFFEGQSDQLVSCVTT